MYNLFEQLRLFAYNQVLSKKVSRTKIDDVEGKDVPHSSKNNVMQDISANIEESERILLEKSTTSCREIKSKSDTYLKESSKTVLNTAKKCLSLSDLKRHIACMNIKKFTRTQKNDIMKPNIICSSRDTEKKTEPIKSRHQRRHKHVGNNESHSSCDLFGFYKNRRRKHISPYELYVQSVKPVITKNFSKLKKCGSKIIRHEGSAKDIPFLPCHHGLKVITSNHAKMKMPSEHEDEVSDSEQCFKNRDEINYSLSLPRQNHKMKHDLPSRNESNMCHLTETYKHKHRPKKKRRVSLKTFSRSYCIPKDYPVDVACGVITADQSVQPVVITQESRAIDAISDPMIGRLTVPPKLITQNLSPKHEFSKSPIPCVPTCECMFTPSQSVIEENDNATQTSTYPCRILPFSSFLPKPYKKSVKCIANLHINNPDPKSMVKCILICLVVTVWSPILLAISIGWLLSYLLRPCIICERNLQYKRKCMCRNPSNCRKPELTRNIVQACKVQPLQRPNQKQASYTWRTLFCCRRRDLRRNYSVFRAECRTNKLHASQHRANTITNFFDSVFCSSHKNQQSNVRPLRSRRNTVALKNNSSKEATLKDGTRHPIKEFSPRPLPNLEDIKVYPVYEIGNTTEPKRKSVNLQTYDDKSKSDDEFNWSSFFSQITKLVENYLVHSKYMTPSLQTFSKKNTDDFESKHAQRQCFRRPTSFFSKNLRGQPRYSCETNKRIESNQCLKAAETEKYNHQKQKVINFADEVTLNRQTCELRNKNTETDPLNKQIKRKNLFRKLSRSETETNLDESTQNPVGRRKHTALNSLKCQSPLSEEIKCLHLVSPNSKIPVSVKTKEANTTTDPNFPLSETTKRQSAHIYTVNECPASSHMESLSHSAKEVNNDSEINKNENAVSSGDTKLSRGKLFKIKKPNVTIGSDQKPKTSYSCLKLIHKLTEDSSTSKYPISSDAECSCGLKGKDANLTVRMNKKSKSNSSCQCHIIKPPVFGPSALSSDCKCPICVNKKNVCHNMNNANAAVKTDQKSKSTSSCQCQLIKLPHAGSVVRKCTLGTNSENFCHNCHKKKNSNAAVETDQKLKSNTRCQCHLIKSTNFAPAGSFGCKSPNSKSTESLRLKRNEAYEYVRTTTDQNAKPGASSCQCQLIKLPHAGSVVCKCTLGTNSKNFCHTCHDKKNSNAAVETDQKLKSNTRCQCHLIKPTNFAPAGSFVCKSPNSKSTESLRHKRNEAYECVKTTVDQNAKPGSDLKNLQNTHERPVTPKISKITKYLKRDIKISTSCQCHLLKPTQFPPDLSTECLCPNCHKKQGTKVPKTSQYSELSTSCNCPRDGSQKANAAIETDPKLKFSHVSERVELNNVPNDSVHTPFQQDALNVYKLCPIGGDTDRLKKTKKRKQLRNNKTTSNKCIHTPEYQNVCSEVCSGILRGKEYIARSLSNINENCPINKQTRTSKANSTRYKNFGTTVNTCFANKRCKMKKKTQRSDKPIQATKTDKSQNCPCPPPSKPTNFCYEKSCSSQTFKNTTFATPYNEQTCKRRKPTRLKYMASTIHDFVVGKYRRKKCNKKPFETLQSSGILNKTPDYIKQNYGTEFQQCYGDSAEPKSRTLNTALSPTNHNLKTDGHKNNNKKCMDFNYFTMLKDYIDSRTLQNCNLSTQHNKTNSMQSKTKSPYNNMLEMQKQYLRARSDSHGVEPPLVACGCNLPRISSVSPLAHSVMTECKFSGPKPSFPTSCSCEHGVSGQNIQQQQYPPHNSNIMEINQLQCTSPPNHKLSFSKRSTNIHQKLSKMRNSIKGKKNNQKLCSQSDLNVSKPNEQKVSQDSPNNLQIKKYFNKATLSCGLISCKGDFKPGRCHRRPCTQVIVTGKGDNSLSFNDKRDLIKMCFNRKVKLTPSLVKCLSDSLDTVSKRKRCPRMIEHLKLDKPNKKQRIKLECTAQISNATGNQEGRIHIKKPIRHEYRKYEKGMGDAGQCKYNDCKCNDNECKRPKRKTKKCKPCSSKTHHKKICQRKSFWFQKNQDKKPVRTKPVRTKLVRSKPVRTNPVRIKPVRTKLDRTKPVKIKYYPKKTMSKKSVSKKTMSKISVKKSRKKKSTFSGSNDELQCSDLYLVTLRERPWFWIYKLLPKCYPSFLRFRLCSKTICTQFAFSLTCCLWAPLVVICVICYELFSCCQ